MSVYTYAEYGPESNYVYTHIDILHLVNQESYLKPVLLRLS